MPGKSGDGAATHDSNVTIGVGVKISRATRLIVPQIRRPHGSTRRPLHGSIR